MYLGHDLDGDDFEESSRTVPSFVCHTLIVLPHDQHG